VKETETIETLLANPPFLEGMEPRHLSFIAGCGSNVHFEAGQYIFREGGRLISSTLSGTAKSPLRSPCRGEGP
jgi:hypothetical protein